MIEILYEDKYLLVCVKPVGILSQEDLGGSDNLVSLLNDYLKQKGETANIKVVHRLDRNVGGVMVYSKSGDIAGKLSSAIMDKSFIKEYMAVVHNRPDEESGIYKDLLFKDSSKNKTFVVNKLRKGVKEASLEFKIKNSCLTPKGMLSLIHIRLHTGRTHQIRVQFSSRKMPLLGDGKYGSKDNNCEIALWSYRLSFNHPIMKKQIDIINEPPKTYPWDLF